jgi:hypothetical protein
MLDAEEARTRLAALVNDGWRHDAAHRIRKLKRKLRPAASVFLEADTGWASREEQETFGARLRAAAATLDELSGPDLATVMSCLHPQLAGSLARWWTDAPHRPYTQGWARRAFRCPGDLRPTQHRRALALHGILTFVGPYARDADWVAAWAPHISPMEVRWGPTFADSGAGSLLASAIDLGGPVGDEVVRTLVAIGNGDHAVGVMGRHVIVGLLQSSRADAWDYVERMLLSAQRQEGLRQAILESVDEAHPEAFDRMLSLVLEHDLLRFAATVRAVGVWLGLPADVQQIPLVRERVTLLRELHIDGPARSRAFASDDAWTTYSALCAAAMHDVAPALQTAERLAATSPTPGVRAAVARFATATGLTSGTALLFRMLDDPDVGVSALAHSMLEWSLDAAPADTFERLERLANRLPPKDGRVESLGVEPSPVVLSRAKVLSTMLRINGGRPLQRMLPWLPDMDARAREVFAAKIGEQRKLTPDLQAALVRLLGDPSGSVRGSAVWSIKRIGLRREDAPALEALLTRKSGDLRRGVIELLSRQPVADAVASANRLWSTGHNEQRDGACEVLSAVPDRPAQVVQAAQTFARDATAHQQQLLGDILGTATVDGAHDPGLGLHDPNRRTVARQPTVSRGNRRFSSDAALRIVSAIDDLAHDHRDTTVSITSWQGTQELLLADVKFLPSPFRDARPDASEDGSGLILAEVFTTWWQERPAALRDAEGLDALRAIAATTATRRARPYGDVEPDWWLRLRASMTAGPTGELRHPETVQHVLAWMLVADATTATVDECLDALELIFASVPAAAVKTTPKQQPTQAGTAVYGHEPDWRNAILPNSWNAMLDGLFLTRPELFDRERLGRWFRLERWLDEPIPGARRRRPNDGLLLAAHDRGQATDDDVLDALLQPHSRLLKRATRRRRGAMEERHPHAVELADRLRTRILEIECTRGELPTAASPLVGSVSSIEGTGITIRLLGALGKATLARGAHAIHTGRAATLSHLVQVAFPAPGDSAQTLKDAAKAAKVADRRLIELAMFAPQWAGLVEQATDRDGLEDAIWWFHAHTKDDRWSVEHEVRETWAARSAERTSLAGSDRIAGAVDVAWFERCHGSLGEQRWKELQSAAKFASDGSGHRRAQVFADAIRGQLDEDELVARIRTKRNQDAVRSLGLLPLPNGHEGHHERRATMLRRYQVIREFERGSSKFGSQRQASERLAARIGVENLARSGGYRDPQRFVWAMEAAEAGALADGPIEVTEGDVTVQLSVDADGVPDLTVTRAGRVLKSVPAALRKHEQIAALRDRKTALTRQASRVRASLEESMVRADRFDEDDFRDLARHPLVAPMLELVVLVDEHGRTMRRRDAQFVDVDGSPIADPKHLRIAHPVDLATSGHWVAWQELLFADAVKQPFRQVFRELYVPTDTERAGGPGTRRYEGHQLQPRQASALFGRRGWLHNFEELDVTRVFHDHGVVAHLLFRDGFLSPAEVELPTIGEVYFTRRGEHLALPIDAVPTIVFSEAMRDLDLVVSVAHAGGVDPEATASTVEMRAALVRETCRLTKLDNVRQVGSHVVIDGSLGEYSVHLGSGVVHRRPGGAVCIIPVDSQRRGRIFLPFADDDPKTAEIVAKVLLLARDHQIKDPSILSQLRS